MKQKGAKQEIQVWRDAQHLVIRKRKISNYNEINPDAGRDWGQEEKGTTEDEMVGRHHWLDGHGFGWTLGVGDRQRGLACGSSWGRKETWLSNWTELNWTMSQSAVVLINRTVELRNQTLSSTGKKETHRSSHIVAGRVKRFSHSEKHSADF